MTGDITCLVGKNEAGKTAVLEALYRLNPVISSHGNFNVTHDYPRTDVEDYEHLVQTGKRKPATIITAYYELSDDEVEEVEEQFGAGVFVDHLAKLWRGYENKTDFDINVNERIAVRHLVAQAELPDDVRANAAQASTLVELLATLTTSAENQDSAREAALVSADQLEDASEKAKATDDANRLQESAAAKQLRADISTYLEKSFKEYVWNTYLDNKVPSPDFSRRKPKGRF